MPLHLAQRQCLEPLRGARRPSGRLLDVDEAIIDGEVIVIDETGRPSVHLSERAQNWKLGPKQRAPVLVPGEGRTVVTEVARERRHAVAGVGEFEDARDDELEIAGVVQRRGKHRQLEEVAESEVNTIELLAEDKVQGEGIKIA